jgi:hypothetical protein
MTGRTHSANGTGTIYDIPVVPDDRVRYVAGKQVQGYSYRVAANTKRATEWDTVRIFFDRQLRRVRRRQADDR